jgi:hypothetical protein
MSVQVPNGVVDILVEDEAEAVSVARQYMSYFQGRIDEWNCPDQRELRHVVPENRLRSYDMRTVIETLADDDSMLEIRRGFGHGMITAFIRVEGRPLGVIANNPMHLGGAIDSDVAERALLPNGVKLPPEPGAIWISMVCVFSSDKIIPLTVPVPFKGYGTSSGTVGVTPGNAMPAGRPVSVSEPKRSK